MEWSKQSENIEIPTFVIVKVRQVDGRWDYQVEAQGNGDWSDLVDMLYNDYGQFSEKLESCTSKRSKYEKMDEIAEGLSAKGQAYEFKLADGTDNWYLACCKSSVYRVDHEGKLG